LPIISRPPVGIKKAANTIECARGFYQLKTNDKSLTIPALGTIRFETTNTSTNSVFLRQPIWQCKSLCRALTWQDVIVLVNAIYQ
jgi:hypothetical protein